MEFETRLMEEREKQGVQSPLSYQISMAQGDIQQNGATNVDDSFGNISSYKLLQILLNDSWKASNSAEHHLKSIRRKIVNMLPKCIWSIKVIRLLFRVMGEKLDTIDQKQGDRSISNAICVDHRFTDAIKAAIESHLHAECQKIESNQWIMWANNEDILAGYSWYTRKILTTESLLTLKPLTNVIKARCGLLSFIKK